MIETIDRQPIVDDEWVTKPWPLPEPMTAKQYQREANADADDDDGETFCDEE